MRVLHVITGLGKGGAEAALFRLVTHDRKNIHHVVSLTGSGWYGEKLRSRGIPVIALGMSGRDLGFRAARLLWKVIRSSAAEVVQTWMYHADLFGGVMARCAGVPVIWGIRQTLLLPKYTSRRTVVLARVCAVLSRRLPAAIVSCSERGLQVHRDFGYDGRQMVVIPNGYDLAAYAPDPASRARFRAELGLPDELPVVGLIARFDPCKDHANLIEACRQLQASGGDFRLVLAGTGIDEANHALVDQLVAARLKERTFLLGFRPDVAVVMNGIDVHVLSSFTEAFPNVVAEAMACGTPCITTDAGDASQIVDSAGWVVPPGDPGRLSAALREALALRMDQDQWGLLQDRSRRRIQEEFSIERMIEAFEQVWVAARATRIAAEKV